MEFFNSRGKRSFLFTQKKWSSLLFNPLDLKLKRGTCKLLSKLEKVQQQFSIYRVSSPAQLFFKT